MTTQPIRILYVDDNPLDRELVRDSLINESNGFELIEVSTRAQFEKTLTNEEFDLVLSDFHILGYNGLDILKIVQDNKPEIPVVIVTGTGSEEIAVQAMKMGAASYVIKTPHHIKGLPLSIRNAIDKYNTEKEKKRTQEALKASEQQFRALFENSPIGIGVANFKGELLAFNKAILTPGGYSKEDIEKIGGVSGLYYDLNQREEALNIFKTKWVLQNYPVLFKRKDGTPYNALLTLTTTTFNNQPAIQALVEDVTERTAAETLREVLLEIMQGAATTKELPDFLSLVHRAINRILYAKNFFVMVYNKEKDWFEEVYAVDEFDPIGQPTKNKKSLSAYVFRSQKPLLLNDKDAFEKLVATGEVELVGTNSPSWLGVPLKTTNETIGVMVVQDYFEPNRYSQRELTLLNSVAGQMALVLENKKAESNLRKQEEQLRFVSNHAPVLIAQCDAQKRYTFVNKPYADLFNRTQHEIIGLYVKEVMGELIFSRAEPHINRVLAGFPTEYDMVISRENEADLLMHVNYAPEFDLNGTVIGFVAAIIDISERKQMEQAITESEDRYRDLVENSQELICTHDLNGNILSANRAMVEKSGYPLDVLMQKNIFDLLSPDVRRIFPVYINRNKTMGRANGLMKIITAKGETRYWEYYTTVRTSGVSQPVVRGMAQDVTERKLAEQQLKESHLRVEGIINSAMDAIITVDEEQKIVLFNPAAEKMFLVSQKEAIHSPIERFIPKRFRGNHSQHIEKFSHTGVTSRAMGKLGSLKGLRSNGEEFPIEASISQTQHKTQKLFTVILRDITEREEADFHLRQYADIVKNMQIGLYVLHLENLEDDHSFKVISANPAALIASGTTANEIINQPLDEAFPDLREKDVPQKYAEVVRTQEAIKFELTYFESDSQTLETVYDVKAFPLPNNNLGVAFERITERKQAENEIKRLKEFDENLLNNMAEGIVVQNAAGYFTFMNPAVEEITGYTALELVGQHWTFFIPPDQHDLIIEADRHRLIGESTKYEADILHKNGKRISLLISGSPIFENNQFSGSIVVFIDITERKQKTREVQILANISAALRKAESRPEMMGIILEKITELFDGLGAAIVFKDEDQSELIVELAQGEFASHNGIRFELGEGVVGQVILNGESSWNNDCQLNQLFNQTAKILEIKAAACVPLNSQEQTIGAMVIGRNDQFNEDDIHLLTSIADMSASAFLRAALHEQTERHLQNMIALRAIDSVITSSTDLRYSLAVLLDHITTQLKVDAATILLLDTNTYMLTYADGKGFFGNQVRQSRVRFGEGLSGKVAAERKTKYIPDLRQANDIFMRKTLLNDENFITYFGAPLIVKGEVKGVLELFHRAALKPSAEWWDFFQTLAGQTAIAIDNAQLFEGLQRANFDLSIAYEATIEGWSHALDLRDKETEGHTLRVTDMTLRLARYFEIDEEQYVNIRRGALLHDIGKMGVPDTILLKPGKLTDEEWVMMKKHPQFAYDLIKPIPYLAEALDIPYCHHEKWDGSGYPRGLKGEQIPLSARIFAIVDVWDAVTSDRPYRKAWTKEEALTYIKNQTDTHFDPQIVRAFLTMMNSE